MNTPDKKEITVEPCSLHRAGFIADNPMKDYEDATHEQMIERIATKPKYEPGLTSYSDVSFTVREIVKAASGGQGPMSSRRKQLEPAGMKDTTYLPPDSWKDRIAPTQSRHGALDDRRSVRLTRVRAGWVRRSRRRRQHGGRRRDAGAGCRLIKGETDGARPLSPRNRRRDDHSATPSMANMAALRTRFHQ
jgi:CubicO group peptidase (beta-lactamase class C family)